MLTDEERKLVEIVKGYLPCYEDEEDDHWIISMAKDLIKAQLSQSDEKLVERIARYLYQSGFNYNILKGIPHEWNKSNDYIKCTLKLQVRSLLSEIKPSIMANAQAEIDRLKKELEIILNRIKTCLEISPKELPNIIKELEKSLKE